MHVKSSAGYSKKKFFNLQKDEKILSKDCCRMSGFIERKGILHKNADFITTKMNMHNQNTKPILDLHRNLKIEAVFTHES